MGPNELNVAVEHNRPVDCSLWLVRPMTLVVALWACVNTVIVATTPAIVSFSNTRAPGVSPWSITSPSIPDFKTLIVFRRRPPQGYPST